MSWSLFAAVQKPHVASSDPQQLFECPIQQDLEAGVCCATRLAYISVAPSSDTGSVIDVMTRRGQVVGNIETLIANLLAKNDLSFIQRQLKLTRLSMT